MQSAPSNLDWITSRLNFATALLSFLAVLFGIGYAIVTKLKSAEDPKKTITRALRLGGIVFPMTGFIAFVVFRAHYASLGCYAVGCGLISMDYVRGTVAPKRIETLLLVVVWATFMQLVSFDLISGLSDLLGRIVGILERTK